jgi:hypothetical protein
MLGLAKAARAWLKLQADPLTSRFGMDTVVTVFPAILGGT